MADSVRPRRRQPTRLPRPWDSPGKNTGVGCHFLLQCRKVKSESEVAQSCPTCKDPMDCSLPGSSVHAIFQARGLEWRAIAFSKRTANSTQIFASGLTIKMLPCSLSYLDSKTHRLSRRWIFLSSFCRWGNISSKKGRELVQSHLCFKRQSQMKIWVITINQLCWKKWLRRRLWTDYRNVKGKETFSSYFSFFFFPLPTFHGQFRGRWPFSSFELAHTDS